MVLHPPGVQLHRLRPQAPPAAEEHDIPAPPQARPTPARMSAARAEQEAHVGARLQRGSDQSGPHERSPKKKKLLAVLSCVVVWSCPLRSSLRPVCCFPLKPADIYSSDEDAQDWRCAQKRRGGSSPHPAEAAVFTRLTRRSPSKSFSCTSVLTFSPHPPNIFFLQ